MANLDSLAGDVRSVTDRFDPLSERADLLDRNYHELPPRVFEAEQRLVL